MIDIYKFGDLTFVFETICLLCDAAVRVLFFGRGINVISN